MASWDIQPQGVQGQLKVVGRHAEDLGDALNSLLCDMPRRGVRRCRVRRPAPHPYGPVVPQKAPWWLSRTSTGLVGAALAEYVMRRKTD
ncbi:DUF6507 family protein [Streptomyces sp. NPDC020742]|uniref:DUF6507 family protein n=1 Tax=Streptomyces sp. NPDC020742 TaxID=3154897 RepID=UPI00340F3C7C